MGLGSLALVLHAHLPYVRHPEHAQFLEEDWLYEAISETYLPLLLAFDRLAGEGLRFRLTLTLTPTLMSMLDDALLRERYAQWLDRACALAEREQRRTRDDPEFAPVARFYLGRFQTLRHAFTERYQQDLVGAFQKLQEGGWLEIITCCATHGFLPLMQSTPEAARAQIAVGAAHYRQRLGQNPKGLWLAECGYYPGVEKSLAEEGIRYFFVDTHGLTDATPRPLYGPYAPVYTEAGVAAFARDPESSRQVWSAETGYPGDPVYREFYRDIGFDLDLKDLEGFLPAAGERKNTGFKYHRITDKSADKKPYVPALASARAQLHAADFLAHRERQVTALASQMGPRKPIVVAPYDAELFGHWWFEGPLFLEALIRQVCASKVLDWATPGDDLDATPENQLATPALSSWGEKGYASMWLNGTNDWLYRHLHTCAQKMTALAQDFAQAEGVALRALNQAARELLLAQASDWAFILKTGTVVDYALRRIHEHLLRFLRLDEQLRAQALDEGWLAQLEAQSPLFRELDYRIYQRRG